MRIIVKILLVFLLTSHFVHADERPNIIFILTDDQRYDFLQFIGKHAWIRTPNLDALASSGIHFKNAFVTTSLCSPSRASIITGRYLRGHGVSDNDTPLPSGLPTYPKVLEQAGYQTAFMGKWHMGGDGVEPQPGFGKWISFRGQGIYVDPVLSIDGREVATTGYLTDILTDSAVSFIKNRDKTNPYFICLSHKAIHEPFTPAPRHQGTYDGLVIPRPETFEANEENHDGKPAWVIRQRKSWHGADRDYSVGNYGDFDRFFQQYSEALLAVDESVGKIVRVLEENNELENTVIVFFSDNGYLMGEHGLIDKRVMYEESIRVPCIVHWPSKVGTGTTLEQMVLNIDLGPTFLELAGCAIPASMHGKSFAKLILGESVPWRKDFLYEYDNDPAAVQTPTIIGLRTERYSYMTNRGVWDNYELYDLKMDPLQQHNLLGDVVFGQTYGRFLPRVREQLPELWPLVETLENRMAELIEEIDQ